MKKSKFVNLHGHSHYSQLDGLGSSEQFAKRASELGYSHLGRTEHGNIDGILDFQSACKKYDITPVFGSELYIVKNIEEKESKRFHINAFVQNANGLKNLYKMLTIANLEGFYKRPRVDPSIILDNKAGLMFSSACALSFINMEGGLDLLYELHKNKQVYLEIMPHNEEIQKEINLQKLRIHYGTKIPLLATLDAHYPLREHAKTQEVLLAIQRKAKWNDPNRWRFTFDSLYLQSYSEVISNFEKQGVIPRKDYLKAIHNTVEFANFCEFEVPKLSVDLPKIPTYEKVDEDELLVKLINEGLEEKGLTNKIYKDRIEKELEVIRNFNFQRYFLIVWELTDWCKKNDILTGFGRGSVGGSLIAFAIGITLVDPIKYNLVFERFLNPGRSDSFPDIDCDIEDNKRALVRQHLNDLYGKYNVVGLSTFLTLKSRGALRDVARVFDVNLKDVDIACKSIPQDMTIQAAIDAKIPEITQFNKQYKEIVDIAISLDGQIKGCVSGDSRVLVEDKNTPLGFRVKKIKKLYEGKFEGKIRAYDFEEKILFFDDVKEIFYTGKKKTRKIIVKIPNHRKKLLEIIITPEDKLLKKDGWALVSDLSVGDIIAINGKKGQIPWNKGKKGLQEAWNKGIKGQIAWNKGLTKEDHPTILESSRRMKENNPSKLQHNKDKISKRSYKNGITYTKIYKKENKICKVSETTVVHHIDKNKYNNPIDGSNWLALCHSCHCKIHNRKIKKINNLTTIDWGKIISIEEYKIIDTYEIEMVSRNKNFVCNKIIKHNSSQHPAAVCISRDDLRFGQRCNLAIRKGVMVSNLDMSEAETRGLMKLDILGLSALTIINHTKKLIKQNYDVDISWDKIPLDEKRLFKEMSDGHTAGIFQFNAGPTTKLCQEMKLENFNDMVMINALVRPGTLASGLTKSFIERKHGEEKITYIHPKLKKFTDWTYGIIVFQEQIMWLMNEIAALDWSVCDQIRKVIGKSKGEAAFNEFKQIFIDGCKKNKTLSSRDASDVWEKLSAFGSYSFNLAHSVEYSLISYLGGWLKINYPKEYMCALLTYESDKKPQYISEAKRLGLEVILPSVGTSDISLWKPSKDSNKIYAPFTEIKGIGESKAKKLSEKKYDNGFNFFNLEPIKSDKFDIVLDKMGKIKTLTDEEISELQQYFDFPLDRKGDYFKKLGLGRYELDDILNCNINGFKGNLLEVRKFPYKIACSDCELIRQCKAPVSPSFGRYNVMVLGEAPGKDENDQGIGFVGRSGKKLWGELEKYNLHRNMFHILNATACYPAISKTPEKTHIKACSRHVNLQIKELKPILILAFGNTALKLLKEQDSGITKMNGITEWHHSYNCWIHYCIHPASALYNSNNKEDFEKGIRTFVDVLRRIGGNYLSKVRYKMNGVECPLGGIFCDENNEYEECGQCEIWEDCAKAKSLKDWR
jgi:uracil-DNA glycosylase family 4